MSFFQYAPITFVTAGVAALAGCSSGPDMPSVPEAAPIVKMADMKGSEVIDTTYPQFDLTKGITENGGEKNIFIHYYPNKGLQLSPKISNIDAYVMCAEYAKSSFPRRDSRQYYMDSGIWRSVSRSESVDEGRLWRATGPSSANHLSPEFIQSAASQHPYLKGLNPVTQRGENQIVVLLLNEKPSLLKEKAPDRVFINTGQACSVKAPETDKFDNKYSDIVMLATVQKGKYYQALPQAALVPTETIVQSLQYAVTVYNNTSTFTEYSFKSEQIQIANEAYKAAFRTNLANMSDSQFQGYLSQVDRLQTSPQLAAVNNQPTKVNSAESTDTAELAELKAKIQLLEAKSNMSSSQPQPSVPVVSPAVPVVAPNQDAPRKITAQDVLQNISAN